MGTRYPHLRAFLLKTYLHLFIIAIIGVTAYSNTFHSPFVFDDFDMIRDNQMIRSLGNFLLALKGHDFGSTAYQYTPSRFIGYLSFALNYQFGGVDVKWYHAVNLAVHILNGLLVYFFVVLTFRTPYFNKAGIGDQGLGAGKGKQNLGTGHPEAVYDPQSPIPNPQPPTPAFIALFSALLFVSHPLQTQAVTYIVQRFTSLAALFYMLSIVLYIKGRLATARNEKLVVGSEKVENARFTFHDSRFAIVWYLLSLIAAVLAMRTKEIAYTLPMVIILYEATFFTAPLKKKLLLFVLPVVLILMIVFISIIQSDKPLGEILSRLEAASRAETNMPRWDYLMTEMRVVVTYVRLIILPINQNFDYDYPVYHSFFASPVVLSFFLLSTLLATSIYLLYKAHRAERRAQSEDVLKLKHHAPCTVLYAPYYRLIGFGVLWFFITLSVESSIIPIKDVIVEHRVYLPSVGFLTAITAGIFAVAARFKKEKSTALILVLIILALPVATYARNNVWKDAESLWEDVVKKSPNLARAHTGLGSVYYSQGRPDEAMGEFQTAVSLNLSDYVAHYGIGLIYEQQGQLDEARKEFQIAAALKPDKTDIHNSLGRVYEQQGFPYDAIKEYQEVLRLNPYRDDARNRLEVLNKKMSTNNH